MSRKITIALVDDQAELVAKKILGEAVSETLCFTDSTSGTDVEFVLVPNPDEVIHQMTVGRFRADTLLLDIDFSESDQMRLKLVDCPDTPNTRWGIEVLHTIKRIDPDFPVVMLTSLTSAGLAFDSGKIGADGYLPKRELDVEADREFERPQKLAKLTAIVFKAMESCSVRTLYSHEHLTTADAFAAEYDATERQKIATVAYYQYETDRIDETMKQIQAENSSSRRLRILDVGCGTGRVEEALSATEWGPNVDIIAVDFSGAMIDAAHSKLSQSSDRCSVHLGHYAEPTEGKMNVSLFRAPAERLGFLASRFPHGFDFVVLGFGFLSYVNYREVLKSQAAVATDGGVYELLRPGGRLLFSLYNEASAVYDRIAKVCAANDEMPVAAVMDPATGFLQVDLSRYFACDSFTVARVTRFMRQGGLTVDPQDVETFPTLHLMVNQSECENFAEHPLFPPGRFDADMYRLDRRLSSVLPGRGHYIVGVARRPVITGG